MIEAVIPVVTVLVGVAGYMIRKHFSAQEANEQIQNARLNDVETKLISIETKFAAIEERTIHIDKNIERILNRLENV